MSTVTYASMSEANAYFATRLHSGRWGATNLTDRTNAMLEAARIIDRLNYAGDKTDPDQTNEFPRDSDTDIPVAIKESSYEIAYALIDGVDPEAEVDQLGVVSEGYSSVRTTYARDLTFDHLVAGVPSAVAWRMLKPYLRDVTGFKMSRVS
jgi:hypothetical protein